MQPLPLLGDTSLRMRSYLLLVVVSATDDVSHRFRRDGFAIIERFSDEAELGAMRSRIEHLMEAYLSSSLDGRVVFRTDEEQLDAQGKSQYFFDSAERVHFFVEEGGSTAINKAGHGLHYSDDVFGRYARSLKVSELLTTLGFRDPRLPQSMYIFKPKFVGGAVTPHQDACFLETAPNQTVVGLWLAIDDATLNNGCLWARNGSHVEPLRRRFVRSLDQDGQLSMVFEDMIPPERAMLADKFVLDRSSTAEPSASPSDSYLLNAQQARSRGFVPIPVRAGDLVVLAGTLDHFSLSNTSPTDRHTFQLHVVEGPLAGYAWSERNWLQLRDTSAEFMRLLGASGGGDL